MDDAHSCRVSNISSSSLVEVEGTSSSTGVRTNCGVLKRALPTRLLPTLPVAAFSLLTRLTRLHLWLLARLCSVCTYLSVAVVLSHLYASPRLALSLQPCFTRRGLIGRKVVSPHLRIRFASVGRSASPT